MYCYFLTFPCLINVKCYDYNLPVVTIAQLNLMSHLYFEQLEKPFGVFFFFFFLILVRFTEDVCSYYRSLDLFQFMSFYYSP